MDNTKIQWTNATVNFHTGCKKVSPGCKYCYMYRNKERYGKDPATVIRTTDATFYAALKWKEPKMIFTCSWSDFFIEEADSWRDDAWDVIRQTPQHTWQILTKRPENVLSRLPKDWGDGWKNVWLGVSIENQDYINRLEMLAELPACTKFISAEPLIGELDLSHPAMNAIDWVIIGGESGNDTGKHRYRPCKIEWILRIINDMDAKRIPVFVKQLGTHLSYIYCLSDRHGGNIEDWPESLQIREFPQKKLTK